MNEIFNIRITVELGDKELANSLSKQLALKVKEDLPEAILASIPYIFGAVKISEVQYMPHPKENIGAVVMILECSEEQFNKNCEATTK